MANDLSGTSTLDFEPLPPGNNDGFWYLVRGVNCAGPGAYGDGHSSQTGSRNAEILGSNNACP